MKLILDDGQEFEVSTVETSELRDGDIVVLKTERIIDPYHMRQLNESFHRLFGATPVLVLQEGMSLEIVRDMRGKA